MKGWIWVILIWLLGCSDEWVVAGGQTSSVVFDAHQADVAVEQGVDLFEHSTGATGGDGSCVFNGCDDGDSCTHDYCSFRAVSGTWECEADFAEVVCDDGNPCTTGDVCKMGACFAGPPTNCADDDACTTDTCNAYSGCSNAPKNCSDYDVWTADICSNGMCKNEPLLLAVYHSIPMDIPDSVPPNSYAPVVYVGDENLKVFNPSDKWVALSAMMPYGIWFRGYCEGVYVKKPHWNAGYIVSKNGWQVEQKMVGGHALGMSIGYFVSQWKVQEVGEQPTLLPLSGTQEFDAGGKPIPQHYISPNLKKMCEKMIAAQKKSGG